MSIRTKATLVAALAVLSAALLGVPPAAGGPRARAATPLRLASCSDLFYGPRGLPDAILAVDLPLRGPGRAQTLDMAKAVGLVLASHGYRAGRSTIGYQVCDDSTKQGWDTGRCATNAAAYAADSAVLGVVGTFDSGCSAVELPTLNGAPGGPVAMVSPANEYVGLTRAAQGTARREPGLYYPSGKRSYVRLVAADDVQAAAEALLAKRLGRRRVFVLQDEGRYALTVASSFRVAAERLGLDVVGEATWARRADGYARLADQIRRSRAGAVFLGGRFSDNGARLLQDLNARLGSKVQLIAPSAFTPLDQVVEAAGASACEGLVAGVAGLPTSRLGRSGKTFLGEFRRASGRAPDPYAVYAAQATELLLSAIADSDGARPSVTASLLRARVSNGILGSFSVTRTGDITSNPVTIYRIRKGKPAAFAVIEPPSSLVGGG